MLRIRSALAATLALISTLAVAPIGKAAEPGAIEPPRVLEPDYPPPSARTTHLVAGAAMTAAWYGGAVGFSYLWPDAPGASDLRIPIAGPWIALGDTGCAEDEPDCSVVIVVLRAALTIIDGVGQAGGLAIMSEGLFLPTREPKRGARTEPRFSVRPSTINAGRDGVGIGVTGVF